MKYIDNIERLSWLAKKKKIWGVVTYELAICSPKEQYLELFFEAFKDLLNMEYPCRKVDGFFIKENEVVIHIVSLKGTDKKDRTDQRVNIIDLVHEILGKNIWHGSWFTAIGRS